MRLIRWLENFYMKFPPFSLELREFVVKLLPIISLVFGVLLTIASILEILGTPVLSAFTFNRSLPAIQLLLLTNVLGIAQGILMIWAVPSLNRRSYKGWRLFFWSQLVWIISSILSFSPSLIIALILFYPLFQVKRHYQ